MGAASPIGPGVDWLLRAGTSDSRRFSITLWTLTSSWNRIVKRPQEGTTGIPTDSKQVIGSGIFHQTHAVGSG